MKTLLGVLSGLLIVLFTGCGGSSSPGDKENLQSFGKQSGGQNKQTDDQNLKTQMDEIIDIKEGESFTLPGMGELICKNGKITSSDGNINIGGKLTINGKTYQCVVQSFKEMISGKIFYVVDRDSDTSVYPYHITKIDISSDGSTVTINDTVTVHLTYDFNKIIIDPNQYLVFDKKEFSYLKFKFYRNGKLVTDDLRYYYAEEKDKAEAFAQKLLLNSKVYTLEAKKSDINNHTDSFVPKIVEFRLAGTEPVENGSVVISKKHDGRFIVKSTWEDGIFAKYSYYQFGNTNSAAIITISGIQDTQLVECTYKGNWKFTCNGVDFDVSNAYRNENFPIATTWLTAVCDKDIRAEDAKCSYASIPVIITE